MNIRQLNEFVISAIRGHEVLFYDREKEKIIINEQELYAQLKYLLYVTGNIEQFEEGKNVGDSRT